MQGIRAIIGINGVTTLWLPYFLEFVLPRFPRPAMLRWIEVEADNVTHLPRHLLNRAAAVESLAQQLDVAGDALTLEANADRPVAV